MKCYSPRRRRGKCLIKYTANHLNHYTQLNADTLAYDADGGQKSAKLKAQPPSDRDFEAARMCGARCVPTHRSGNCYLLTNGVWSYTWDCENRLLTATSNGVVQVSNLYDHFHRRTKRTTPAETRAYIYDGWNLIQERITRSGGTVQTVEYSSCRSVGAPPPRSGATVDTSTGSKIVFGRRRNRLALFTLLVWGKDVSESLQGAGGVGGLVAVSISDNFYFPCYDHNGNILAYVNEAGSIVAQYTYDAFGNTIEQSGSMAKDFRYRFSTKYYDAETSLYYYGYRFYSPSLSRWLNRDPIEEAGGVNLYAFCKNKPIVAVDSIGQDIYIIEGTGKTPLIGGLHQSICVDVWEKTKGGNWITRKSHCYYFGISSRWPIGYNGASTWLGWRKSIPAGLYLPGIIEDHMLYSHEPRAVIDMKTTDRCEDQKWNAYMKSKRMGKTDVYDLMLYNCRTHARLEFADAPSTQR